MNEQTNVTGLLQQQGYLDSQNLTPRMARKKQDFKQGGPSLEVLGLEETYRVPTPTLGPDFKRQSSHFQVCFIALGYAGLEPPG